MLELVEPDALCLLFPSCCNLPSLNGSREQGPRGMTGNPIAHGRLLVVGRVTFCGCEQVRDTRWRLAVHGQQDIVIKWSKLQFFVFAYCAVKA